MSVLAALLLLTSQNQSEGSILRSRSGTHEASPSTSGSAGPFAACWKEKDMASCFRRKCKKPPIDACVEWMIENEIVTYLDGGDCVLSDLGFGTSNWREPASLKELRGIRERVGAERFNRLVDLERCSARCRMDCSKIDQADPDFVCSLWPTAVELRKYKDNQPSMFQDAVHKLIDEFAEPKRRRR